MAEIGDIARFPDDDALAKYAGLWWPRRQSGEFEAADRSLSKAGNAYLRYYFCEAANSVRVPNEAYRRFFDLGALFLVAPWHARLVPVWVPTLFSAATSVWS